eukprot:gene11963-12106_t
MVTLRDGKRYDVGAAASAASDDYSESARPRRRASAGISSAQQRRSRRSAVAEMYSAYDSEPPTPAATPRRSKRGRAEPLMVPDQQQEEDDDNEMDTGKDQDITPGKSDLNTVQRPDSPSPLPKKKARVEQPKRYRKSVFPDGQQWQDLAVDISDKLRLPAAQRGHKATAMILACASKDDCAEAAAALSLLPPRGDICSLTIRSAELAEASSSHQPAAALQAVVAPFLRRCPKGLVLLLHAERLPVAALLALHNGLSELGGFQHDGSVSSGQAAYAFLLQLPVEQVAEMAAVTDTTAVDEQIKGSFFQIKQQQLVQYQQQVAATDDVAQSEALSALGRVLRTLHRRIDFAAPIRLGPAADHELEQLKQQEAAAAGHSHGDVEEE